MAHFFNIYIYLHNIESRLCEYSTLAPFMCMTACVCKAICEFPATADDAEFMPNIGDDYC